MESFTFSCLITYFGNEMTYVFLNLAISVTEFPLLFGKTRTEELGFYHLAGEPRAQPPLLERAVVNLVEE